MSVHEEFELFFLLMGAVVALLAVYFLLSLIIRMRKSKPRIEYGEVGFVVATFHETVAKLKEKERELDELRKKAEKKAGVIEDYNTNILESVPSGVVSLDASGRVVTMNPAAGRILGLDPSGAVGRDSASVLRGFPLDKGSSGQCRPETLAGGRLCVAYSVTPLLNAEKEDIGRLVVFTDLTELKALEEQAERRQRLSSLGEMAAGIAHELRNPMAVIAGYMRILGKRADPEMLKTVQAVSKEVSAMDRIIEDFLSFANPPAPSLSKVDLKSLIEDCLEGLGHMAGGVRVRAEVAPGIIVEADDDLLKRAFTNLLRNAVEATPEGGEVSVEARGRDGLAEVDISDTGHGIPEALRERIFLPFFTTKSKGTGLGLAVAHGIVTAHAGRIELVRSNENGTIFRVYLPKASG